MVSFWLMERIMRKRYGVFTRHAAGLPVVTNCKRHRTGGNGKITVDLTFFEGERVKITVVQIGVEIVKSRIVLCV